MVPEELWLERLWLEWGRWLGLEPEWEWLELVSIGICLWFVCWLLWWL